MKCIKKNVLLDYLNDELSPRKKKLVSEHLSECPYCRHEAEEWKKVLNLTEQFVAHDIEVNPVPPHAHITQRFENLPQKQQIVFWNWSWAKPAMATAAVILVALMVFFLPNRTIETPQSDFYVIDNVTYTEKVSLSDLNLSDLETIYLNEIYNNEELTHDILYGDWQYYGEVLDNLDQSELEELINKLYDNSVT